MKKNLFIKSFFAWIIFIGLLIVAGLPLVTAVSWNASWDEGLVGYYSMNQSSGTNVPDRTHAHDGTNINGSEWNKGMSGNSLWFNPSQEQWVKIPDVAGKFGGKEEFTISMFVYANTTDSGTSMRPITKDNSWYTYVDPGTHAVRFVFHAGSVISVPLTAREWTHYAFTFNNANNNLSSYKNGVFVETITETIGMPGSPYSVAIGALSNEDTTQNLFWNGSMDEVGIWNKTLTEDEILSLYSFYTNRTTPTITLNSPVEDFNSSSINISFDCSATIPELSGGLLNLTLIIDDQINETVTNTTSTQLNMSFLQGIVLTEGTHNWTCQACSAIECANATEVRNLTIDTTDPAISIIYPNDTYFNIDWFNKVFPEIDLNWSINDSNLGSCWYEYNNTNTSVTCADNYTTFNSTESNQSIKLWANDTMGNINSSTANFFWRYTISNITSFTDNCNDSSINWTDLPDGNYTFNVTVWFNDSTTIAKNATEIRTVYIDTTYPIINYTSDSDVTNISGNFNDKDNVFVNVSINEFNFQNVTFHLWTSLDTDVNVTTFNESTRSINWTNLPENMYFWNVTTCDKANNCNSTSDRSYGVVDVNVSLSLQFNDVNLELGGNLSINATSNLGTICVDIDHPDFGINYSCETWSNVFNMSINYFNKKVFANDSTNWVLNYSGEENQTMNLTVHKYDEVDNLTVNITGLDNEGYPLNLLFYGINTSIFDRFFPGLLIGNHIFVNNTWDFINGSYAPVNDINLSFSNRGEQTIYFWMDDNAALYNFTFNLSASSFGTSYFNNFTNNFSEDPLQTDTLLLGGYILPKGTSLTEFSYDDFNDSSIDSNRWTLVRSNGYVDGGGLNYKYTIDNKEENGYLELGIDGFAPDYAPGQGGSTEVLNEMYANFSLLNSWTPNNIYFEIDYSTVGTERKQINHCNFYHQIKLGTIEVWKSHIEHCEDEDDQGFNDCNDNAEITDNLFFNLTRQSNNSWFVQITGVEEAWGQAHFDDTNNCGTIKSIYNYTNGTKYTFYENPDLIGPDACDDPGFNVTVDVNNSFYISDLDWNDAEQLYFNQRVMGTWDQDSTTGCNPINTWLQIYDINKSLYDLSNGTFRSESIFDSGGDLSTAIFDTAAVDISAINDITLYLSANDGEDWEEVSDGVEHAFSNTGTNLRYRIDMDLLQTGYLNDTPFVLYANITTPQGNPSNITLDFGDDGVVDYSIPGEFNATNGTIFIGLSNADLTTEFARDPTAPYQHLHPVPLVVSTDNHGQINFQGFNLTYNPNPISLNTSFIQTLINNLIGGFNNIFFNVESINGTVNLTDLNYNYAGGNDTIEVIAHSPDYSFNVSRNVTYYYSRWDYEFVPLEVDWLVFTPRSPTDTNVTPYGQSLITPILNLTNYGYGGKNAELSVYVNDTLSCVDIYMSTNNTKPLSSLWDDLVAYWSFDIDARDNEGSNDGTVIDAIHNDTTGQLGGSYEFIGDAYLDMGNSSLYAFQPNDPLSISLWAKFNSSESGRMIGSIETGETENGFSISRTSDLIFFLIGDHSTGFNIAVTSNAVVSSSNQWYNIVVTHGGGFTASNVSIYVNGIDETGSIINDDASAIIYNSSMLMGQMFNGSLDEVKIYNRSLTSTEISSYYNRSSNKYYDIQLKEDWQIIDSNRSYLNTTDMYMWADFNCNFNTWTLFDPSFYFRQCAEDTICSEDLT